MDVPRDDGLTPDMLRNLGLVLGLVAAFAWIKLPDEVAGGFDDRGAVWLGIGVVATVLSACCAVVVAVKRAEARTAATLEHVITHLHRPDEH